MAETVKPLLLDLHIPYCIRPQRCIRAYGVVGTNAQKDAYLQAMKREILAYEGELEGYEIRAVRLGGGSATVMNPDLLGEVLTLIRHHLPMAKGAEVSFDALPNTIGTPSLTGIGAGHPTRAELMMRSENDEELKALECPFSMQNTRNAMLFFHKFHLNNIGLTVNYGIPGQSEHSWKNTLHACTIMEPQHIRVEPLAVTGEPGMPDEAARLALYEQACDFLAENGYAQYAADGFCRPNHEYLFDALRRNGAEYVGLGVDAVSFMDGYLTRNTNNLSLYVKNAGDFEKLTAQAFVADGALLRRDYIEGRLSLVQGLSREQYAARFGEAIPEALEAELDALCAEGLIEPCEEGFRPTRRGLFASQNGGILCKNRL